MEEGVGKRLLEQRPAAPLYHYTSHQALAAIVNSREIWASNVLYLNDREEFTHAFKVCRDVVQGQLAHAEGLRREYLNAVSDSLREDLRELARMIYVASFCEEPDSLSLWRGYTPPRAGYSFGFDWAADDRTDLAFTRCLYEDAEQRAVVSDFLNEFYGRSDESLIEYVKRIGMPLRPDAACDSAFRALLFVQRMSIVAPAMKNGSFKDEREWRVVYFKPTMTFEPEYRCGASMLVPYARIPLVRDGVFHIEEIVVGPTDHPREAKESVDGFLKRTQGVECKSVRISGVPFRHL